VPPRPPILALALGLAVVLTSPPTAVAAQEPAPTEAEVVRVVVRELPPFVEVNADGTYTGFTVQLWEEVAARAGLGTEYEEVGSVAQQLDAVADGDADVGATAISVTNDREARLDFSYPYFQSGLQIMVSADQRVSFLGAVRALWDPAVLYLLGIFAVSIVSVGVLVWLLERRHNLDFSSEGRLRGAEEGLWWAIVTVATVGYGDRVTSRPVSRLIAALWILFGLVFIAQFTAAITANLTLRELASDIRGPDDLRGRDVVTVEGTTADAYLEAEGISVRTVADVDQMVAEIADDRAEAAVFDAPVLLYQVERVGPDQVTTVGAPFTFEYYGFALQPDSPFEERIDRALLGVIEDGAYRRIRRAWFPEDEAVG
jgi:ABC-type amino acid transport substrate-binding protein